MVIDQIKAQLDRIVPVHKVRDLTISGKHIERELALVKVVNSGEDRIESCALPILSAHGRWTAHSIHSSSRSQEVVQRSKPLSI